MFFFKKFKSSPSVTPQPTAPIPPTQAIPPAPVTDTKIKKYKVTGTSHYTENILTLASDNLDYKLTKKEMINEGYENERIYKYEFYPLKTELIPEPDNPYDPNAVKVIIDDVLVGYIKSGSCSHILKIIKENRIVKITSEIGGGKYKYLGYDEDEDSYYLENNDSPYFVLLSITEK